MIIGILEGIPRLPTKYELFSLLFMVNYSFIMISLIIGILEDLLMSPVSLHALYIPSNHSFLAVNNSFLLVLGRQLEESGVLNGALKARGNSWGLHMPLVCPDGAVVAYAWKRQLAGQAGASAVDRTK
jgi:hypothetical protein